MESRIKITAEAGSEGLVEIFGRIGFDWWAEDPEENTAKRIAEKLAELKECESVTVRINSLGGDVDTALAVHGMLKECKNVTTEAVGMVASAATVIFMAGTTRKINKSALFLVHKCSSRVVGNENDLESELETQRTINDTMAEIYTDGGVNPEKVAELMEASSGRLSTRRRPRCAIHLGSSSQARPMGGSSRCETVRAASSEAMPSL